MAKFIGFLGFSLAILTFATLFVKDIFLGDTDYNLGQLGLLGAVILGVIITVVKVWVPILYDGLEIMGRKVTVPTGVSNGSWLKWLLYGLLTTTVIGSAGYLFGVNPLNPASWISIDVATRILQYFMVAVTLIVVCRTGRIANVRDTKPGNEYAQDVAE